MANGIIPYAPTTHLNEITCKVYFQALSNVYATMGMEVVDVDGKIYAIGGSIADSPLSNTSCVGTNEQ